MVKEQFDAAIPVLQKAIDLQPDRAVTWYLQGVCYQVKPKPDYAKARADYEQALKLEPGNQAAANHLRDIKGR